MSDAQHIDLPEFRADLTASPLIETPSTDKGTVRLVVLVLGLVAIAGVILIGVLAYQQKPVSDALIGLSSSALGAVAGLLAKTSSAQG